MATIAQLPSTHGQNLHPTASPPATSAGKIKKTGLQSVISFIDPKKKDRYQSLSHYYETAITVSFVAFAALSIAALAFAAIMAPTYAPFVTLTAMVLLIKLQEIAPELDRTSKKYSMKAAMSCDVSTILKRLPKDTANLTRELSEIGISVREINDREYALQLWKLRPALASYHYWRQKAQEWEQKAVQMRESANTHANDYPTEAGIIREKREMTISIEMNALRAKVQAAYYFGLIKHPRSTAKLKYLIEFSSLSTYDRLLGETFHDHNAENLFSVKRGDERRTVSIEQVRQSSILDISHHIFS